MTMTRMMKSVSLRLVGITTVSTENRLYHDHKKVKNSKKIYTQSYTKLEQIH